MRCFIVLVKLAKIHDSQFRFRILQVLYYACPQAVTKRVTGDVNVGCCTGGHWKLAAVNVVSENYEGRQCRATECFSLLPVSTRGSDGVCGNGSNRFGCQFPAIWRLLQSQSGFIHIYISSCSTRRLRCLRHLMRQCHSCTVTVVTPAGGKNAAVVQELHAKAWCAHDNPFNKLLMMRTLKIEALDARQCVQQAIIQCSINHMWDWCMSVDHMRVTCESRNAHGDTCDFMV